MSRNPLATVYPPEYEHLVRTAFAAVEYGTPPLEVTLDSVALAISLRHRLFGYFKQLRELNRDPELTAMSQQITLVLKDKTITLCPLRETWDAKALRSAMKHTSMETLPNSLPPKSSQTRLLERLALIRNRPRPK